MDFNTGFFAGIWLCAWKCCCLLFQSHQCLRLTRALTKNAFGTKEGDDLISSFGCVNAKD